MRLHVLLVALGLGVLSIAALAKPAHACGGCFQPPSQSGDVITDEKMIFRISPQATTLYDEIEYSGTRSPSDGCFRSAGRSPSV
jgi:hypothetical protein